MNEQEKPTTVINVTSDHVGIADYLPKESLSAMEIIRDLYDQKKTKFVIQLLDSLLKQYPDDLYVKANTGFMLYFCGKKQRAYELLKQNFELNRDNVYARCYFARVCLFMNNLDESINALDQHLTLKALYPDRTDFSVGELAEIFFTFGSFFCKLRLPKLIHSAIKQLKQFLPEHHPYIRDLYEEMKNMKMDFSDTEENIEFARPEASQNQGEEAV